MKKIYSKNPFLTTVLSVVLSVMVIVSGVSAATTISTNINTGGTLDVTGKATLANASTTMLTSTGNVWVNGYATTTASNGNIATAGNISAEGTASTTNLIVGGNSTTVGGIAFGYCTISDSATITASTSKMFTCSNATNITTSHRVFLQATSSLPSGLSIQTASSSAASTIQLTIFNHLPTGVATAPGAISINFLGIR